MDFTVFLIVCPLVFVAGFVDSIAGGGGLISLPAYMIAGLPPVSAIATNKFSSFMGTIVPTFRYWRRGMFSLRRSVAAIFTALIGSAIGARLAMMVSDRIFMIVMAIVLPVTVLLVFKIKKFETGKPKYPPFTVIAIMSGISLVMGVYDGFYGPGTGTFLILLFVYIARLSLDNAAGVSKLINLSTNAAALSVFLWGGVVVFPLALAAAVFGICGNYLGSSVFISKGKNIAKPIILTVLLIFLIKLALDLL